MKVMICTAQAAYPPVAGEPIRNWANINLLREKAQTAVFSVSGGPVTPPGLAESEYCGAGHPAAMLHGTQWLRRPDGLPSDGFYTGEAAAALRRFLGEFAPDVVVLETFFMHRYYDVIREFDVRVILDAHNVEVDIARQLEAAEPPSPIKLQRRKLVERINKAEQELLDAVDQVWVCSAEDAEQMRRDYRVTAPLFVVPNAVDPRPYRRAYPRPPELAPVTGPVVGFPAAFQYPPNQRAAEILIEDIYPRLAGAYPDLHLLLPGLYPTARMRAAAAADPRILVTGRVPEMAPYFQHSSVVVVPLLQGGGTRLKIVEAFAVGVPVVSSAKGAEGLGAEPGKHYLLAETGEEFASAVRRVLDDPEFASRMVRDAGEFVDAELWQRSRAAIGTAIEGLPRMSA